MAVLRRFAACSGIAPALRGGATFMALWSVAASATAQDMPGALLELVFTPAPRAQIAVWLEAEDGRFIRTLALTEAVAYRGIGNRPGASQMNSGYRWPYGRREGVLPIWATRRASAPGARPFRRVIFQDRTYEGQASRSSSDQSIDDYFCLSFDRMTTTRDALDAVSCASVFMSDKGRFITDADVSASYGEPWQDPATGAGSFAPLSIDSLYPPRMDVTRCTASSCYDHADVALFAEHARQVMPDIDVVTMATPPGEVEQSLLFSLPADWPRGSYALWVEVNVEGDYNPSYDPARYPTPTQPSPGWDSWAIDYGYPYRGQPSVAFTLPFDLDAPGESESVAATPAGCSSWDVFSESHGGLEALTGMTDDPHGAPGSGADRLLRGADGQRLALRVSTLADLPEPVPATDETPDPFDEDGSPSAQPDDGGASPEPNGGAPRAAGETDPASGGSRAEPDEGGAVIIVDRGAELDGPVGPIHGLRLGRHPDVVHSHEWITLRFRAPSSEEPLHRYEVRVSTQPIVDGESFIRRGRPAKTATEDAEGAVSLMLPTDAGAGRAVEGEIGNLVARTRYFVAIRATDRFNRSGPISVAEITTTERTFATVSPCFVATAAYGTPMAREVRALRRVRDRYLMSHAPGQALVHAYYAYGARLAAPLRTSAALRSLARHALAPFSAVAALLQAGE